MRRICIALLFLGMAFVSSPAHAEWLEDGTPIYLGNDTSSIRTSLVKNSVGGTYFIWWSHTTNGPVRVMRLDRDGKRVWPIGGTGVTSSTSNQLYADLAADTNGGVFVVWTDDRNGTWDIYAQHFDGEGARLWGPDGTPVATGPFNQYNPLVVNDGFDNIIVCWEDDSFGSDIDLFAQRLDVSGVTTWGSRVTICDAVGAQGNTRMIPDRLGGAIMVWEDGRNGDTDIYSQRVDAAGDEQWGISEQPVCTVVEAQHSPELVEDGAGGGIVVWQDERYASNSDIYAQRLLTQGGLDWLATGAPIAWTAEDEDRPTLAFAGNAGAVIAWAVWNGTDWDIRADRVVGNGFTIWEYGGIPVCSYSGDQNEPRIAATGAAGYIVAWQDDRNPSAYDLYAQGLDGTGAILWSPAGMPVCTASGTQAWTPSYPTTKRSVADDQSGGVVMAFADGRSRFWEVYAQRIEWRHGEWGRPEPEIVEIVDSPGDQGGRVVVRWLPSDRDLFNQQLINHYSIWRTMEPPEVEEGPGHEIPGSVLSSPGQLKSDLPGPVVWVEELGTTQQYWEWVGDQEAIWQQGYSFTAMTRGDSTSADPAEHYFKVVAHTQTKFKFWESFSVAGHSVDNLAPAGPLSLAGQRVGGDVELNWQPGEVVPDFGQYAIYRSETSGVTPDPGNFLAFSPDTTHIDAAADPAKAYYYIVTAVDVHENESDPSNEVGVSTVGVEEFGPVPSHLTLAPNRPNPFAEATEIRFGLPAASSVVIEVFTISGQRVFTTRLPEQPSGWIRYRFDPGSDRGEPLSGGVYFYRVRADGTTVTGKMIVAH